MIRLIYYSSATKEMDEADLLLLLEQSRARNKRQNITGMLLYKDSVFLQVLEGEAKDVDEIYQSILDDDRNTGNYLIERKEISARNFPQWSMGFRNLTGLKPEELPGYTEFLVRNMTPEEIAKHKDLAVKLLFTF